jgi:lysophospholipase L1-like esterase
MWTMTWFGRAAATALVSVVATAGVSVAQSDRAGLDRYRAEDASLGRPAPGEQRVVFMGDSITEDWATRFDTLFPGQPYVGRGIAGQTTDQMLLRFRQDVVALAPSAVVILGGINDLASSSDPLVVDVIEDNVASMVDIAQANGIAVVIGSVLPVNDASGPGYQEQNPTVLELDAGLRTLADVHDVAYADFHSAMVDHQQKARVDLFGDGLHPNDAGFRVMAPIVTSALDDALSD